VSEETLREWINAGKGTPTDVLCDCGNGTLVVRQGQQRFFGCSNYPFCHRTYSIKERGTAIANPALIFNALELSFGDEQEEDEFWYDMYPGGIHCKDDM
jgi:ssDNA-binding Zn-finger/Zn-ribbon topoisomerase 1